MSRSIGTISRGIRTPIFNEGDDLIQLLPDIIIEAAKENNFKLYDKDVLAITESIVARAQGNYTTIFDICDDLKAKLNGGTTIGLTFPILSRNRFSVLLKGIAMAVDEVILQLTYPADEVGNELFSPRLLVESNINPWTDVLSEKEFYDHFGESKHCFTGIDYIQYYRTIIEEQGAKCTIIFANDLREILKHTKTVLTCDIHSRQQSKQILKENGGNLVLGLDDLLNSPKEGRGYNEDYGLLGSNKADEKRVKLFPRDNQFFVDAIAKSLFDKTGKKIEVMIYGDGAFKDPVGKIWELADPVVSPAYTAGLEGTPNEVKLKYLADNQYKDLSGDEQFEKISAIIKDKSNPHSDDERTGTTPRRITDLLGSLADLTSGSGDKGTPIVYIQGYFDNFTDGQK